MTIFTFLSCSQKCFLYIKNVETNTTIEKFLIEEIPLEFSVEFIHSVNNSPVRDYYEVNEKGEIYVTKTTYYGFGAGVQTELNEGENFSYGENGEMIISNINKKINSLTYYVGTVSDHILRIKNQVISLKDLCGKNAHIKFVVE